METLTQPIKITIQQGTLAPVTIDVSVLASINWAQLLALFQQLLPFILPFLAPTPSVLMVQGA